MNCPEIKGYVPPMPPLLVATARALRSAAVSYDRVHKFNFAEDWKREMDAAFKAKLERLAPLVAECRRIEAEISKVS